jgi:membrane protein DedA with SNARE-associated domain
VFKVQDEMTESALCVGIIAALIWGIGLSLYGFHQGPGQLSWTVWSAQLVGGILACLVVPLVFVRGREWVLARIQAQPRQLQRSQP